MDLIGLCPTLSSSNVTPPKLHIFYHIYCNENTLNVVKDQVTKIVFSGLYDSVTRIHCFLVGDSNILVQVVELLESSGKKFHIEDISTEDTSYERFTILKINQFLNPQDFFLYIHSGNFWWCKAEYFLSLDTKNMERSFYGSTYLACEMFLLCGMKDDYTKAFEIAKATIQNHYLERYPWSRYITT